MTEGSGLVPPRRPRRLPPPATVWTPEEWARIRRGGTDGEYDPRWWVVVEGAWVHMRRGNIDTTFSARFESTTIGWRMAELYVSGDLCPFMSPVQEVVLATAIIDACFTDRGSGFERGWGLHSSGPDLWGEAETPLPRSYWVEPGWLLAGCYPGDIDVDQAAGKLRKLHAAGVRHIIDLTLEGESSSSGPLVPYDRSAADFGMTVRRVAIRAGSTPTDREADVILDEIDQALAAGRPTYVHALGDRGRSALVAGLWMLHSGMADKDNLVGRLTEVGTHAGVDLQLSSMPAYVKWLLARPEASKPETE